MTPEQFREYQIRMSGKAPVARQMADGIKRELDLHDQIIGHCQAQFPRWKYIRARPDQPSGIAVGAQDFTIFMPNRVLCIECKRPGSKLDSDQLAWRKEMEMLGHQVHTIYSMEEFLNLTRPIEASQKATI